MRFNRYYQDELSFLNERGREFAQSQPSLAGHLSKPSNDPDVERLLEGFAFLTGRIREKLEDEFPQLTQGLINVLWPHYLRPLPSASVVEFKAKPGMVRERKTIPRESTEILSVPVNGTNCRFRTCLDVDLYPIELDKVVLETPAGERALLRLMFRAANGFDIAKLKIGGLRLYLAGEFAFDLYLWLCGRVHSAVVRGVAGVPIAKHVAKPRPVGFTKKEALLPYPAAAFEGYRLLQEYFTFPEKFLFVEFDMPSLADLRSPGGFEIACSFTQPPPAWRVTNENIRLYCAPVVNLFEAQSEPMRLTHHQTERRINPDGAGVGIFQVNGVNAWVVGSLEPREYRPFYSFDHELASTSKGGGYYRTELRPSMVGSRTETYVSFVKPQRTDVEPEQVNVKGRQSEPLPDVETLVFDLTCTNDTLPGELGVGDIHLSSDTSPDFADFQNVSRVSVPVPAPIREDLQWRFISHLSLNYISLGSVAALRRILELYNLHHLSEMQSGQANKRRVDSLVAVSSEPIDLLVTQIIDPQRRQFKRYATAMRGTAIDITLQENHFAGSGGDLFLFTSILNEFLSLYATLNSFTRLTVREAKRGVLYQWEPRLGHEIAL